MYTRRYLRKRERRNRTELNVRFLNVAPRLSGGGPSSGERRGVAETEKRCASTSGTRVRATMTSGTAAAWRCSTTLVTSPSGNGHLGHEWGLAASCNGGARLPETEEEYVEFYQDRIVSSQSRQLLPLQEDLADWINKTLGLDCLTASNLLDMLDNGVVLCRLARVIQEKMQEAAHHGACKKPIPVISGRCFESAARRSFFARDNMDKFIQFCRKLGVHQHLLFESEDLVLHANPRNVLLCLMEVARIASLYNVEPPGLVQLEREIAEEESQHDSGLGMTAWHYDSKTLRHSSSTSVLGGGGGWVHRGVSPDHCTIGKSEKLRRATSETGPAPILRGASDGIPSDTTEDEWSRGSAEDPDFDDEQVGISLLDRKVQQATKEVQRHCHCLGSKCDKLKVNKVGEGRYSIAGRNVFIRLLKDTHMMVRVGGGWDTLEHFLMRHDPCQQLSRSVSRTNSPVPRHCTPKKYLRSS
ncbi:growth arrest-specific protein 2 isoform X3 [Bemisia tabaci]|uniref:growth arrest-specific protein 2 isoform X3 n=1 Tax=Bemisia tabaci TaxID=7038 RepID=UPI003B28BBF1